jgi:hypothetical protein
MAGLKLKYKNRLTTSYPDPAFKRILRIASEMDISITELQRVAMDFYLNSMDKKIETNNARKSFKQQNNDLI